MGLNFQGEVDNISDRQLAYIKEIIEKKGYSNTKVIIEGVGAAGDNYIANVKRITVTNENGDFKMIAKIAPQNETMRMTTQTEMLFKNEHVMYIEILPKFRELEKKADVPEQDRLRFATCYGSLLEPPNEVILLEDLQASDFTMLDRFKMLSNECVKSILKNFAVLHSLSYVLKNKEPKTFEAMKSNLQDLWSSLLASPDALAYFSKVEKDATMFFDTEEHKRVFRNSVTEAIVLANKFSKIDINSKYSVIQQGDTWINNFMFKFEDDKLQESVMIDYQLSKESNPTCDIQYMIFTSTDHQLRLEHFHDWIDYYHSELGKCLSNFDLKVDYVYPRDQLDADMKKYAKMIFGLSVLLGSVLTMKSEDASKLKEAIANDISEYAMKKTEFDTTYLQLFKSRLQGLVESYEAFELI